MFQLRGVGVTLVPYMLSSYLLLSFIHRSLPLAALAEACALATALLTLVVRLDALAAATALALSA